MKHGHRANRTPTYISWSGARQRCSNPNRKDYADYGGRGITFCVEWDSFEVFLADMGERPPSTTLNRIDNNAGYSKDNCEWASVSEQNRNRRF